MMKRAAVAFLVVASACATSELSSAPPEDLTEEIIGGTDDTGDPAVVALYAREPGAEQGSLCTATLVTPTVLITAAHCVHPDLVGANVEFIAIFNPVVQGSPESTHKKVKEVHWNPQWDQNNLQGGHDIGIAILEQPVTGVVPLPLNRAPLAQSTVGQSVRLVGYGLNDGFGQTGAGTKRQVTTTVQELSDTIMGVGSFGETSCNGDSGGPAFISIGGQEKHAGITSYGMIFCIGSGYYTHHAGNAIDRGFVASFVDGGCTPSCQGKVCGSDGCNGSCGTCSTGNECVGGQCQPRPPGGCTNGQESEPNNSFDSGSPLCEDGTVQGSLSNTADIDYYKFTIPRNSSYKVTITGIDPNKIKGYLKKWGAASKKLLNVGYLNPDDADSRTISKSTTTGGTYYLKVYNYPQSGGSTQPYDVVVDVQ